MATNPFARQPQFYEQGQSRAPATPSPNIFTPQPSPLITSPTGHYGGGTNLPQSTLETPTAGAEPTPPYPNVQINPSGSVTAGGVTYTGSAIVPGTGATANQIQQQSLAFYQTQYEGLGRGRYLQYAAEPTRQPQTTISNFPGAITPQERGFTYGTTMQNYNVPLVNTGTIYPEGSYVERAYGRISYLPTVEEGGGVAIERPATLAEQEELVQKGLAYPVLQTVLPTTKGYTLQQPVERAISIPGGVTTMSGVSEPLYGGSVIPVTPLDVTVLIAGGGAFTKLGTLAATNILLSEGIVNTENAIINKIVLPSNSGFSLSGLPAQAARGTLYLASFPYTGTAYTTQFVKGLLTSPSQVLLAGGEYAVKNPYELSTIFLGGGLKRLVKPFEETINLKPTFTKDYSIAFEISEEARFKMDLENIYKEGKYLPEESALNRDYIQIVTKKPAQVVIETNLLRKYLQKIPGIGRYVPYISREILPEEFVTLRPQEPLPLNVRSFEVFQTEPNFLSKIGTPSRSYQTVYNIEGKQLVNKAGENFNLITSTQLGRLSIPKANEITFKIPETINVNVELVKESAELINPEENINVFSYYRDILGIEGLQSTRAIRRSVIGTGEIKTFIIEKEAPKEAKGYSTIQPTGIKSSPEFFQQLYAEKGLTETKAVPSQLPKIFPPSEKVFSTEIQQQNLPSMVGGQGLTYIPFAGQNLYEVNEGSIFKPRQNVNLFSNQIFPSGVKSEPALKTNVILKEQLKQDTSLISAQIFKPIVETKLNEQLKFAAIEKQQLKQEYFLKQQTKQEVIPDFMLRFRETNTSSPLLTEFNRKERKKIRKIPTYSILLRKRGTFKPIGTDLTKGEALMIGSEKALRDIARTFKIIPTGRTREVFGFEEGQYLPKETQFRQYKIKGGKRVYTPDQFIQRTSANLQSVEEKSQLAEARRLSKLIGTF